MAPEPSSLATDVGRIFRDTRLAMGWSQAELSTRSGVAQSNVSRLERGVHSGVELADLERLGRALGRVSVELHAPFLADRQRQRDLVHARSLSFIASRLARAGWTAETEVEIRGSFGPGWIDVLAWHPGRRPFSSSSSKPSFTTWDESSGRSGWHEHGAWDAALARGWRPRRTLGVLLVVDTAVVHDALRRNRRLIEPAFPVRADMLASIVAEPTEVVAAGRALAMIDPLSRRAAWLRPTPLDGRRASPAYADYAEIGRLLTGAGRRLSRTR